MLSKGNPFEKKSEHLDTLDNRVCESATATVSVSKVECTGQERYNNFKKSVLDSNDTLLTAPIKRKRNNLLMFYEKKA